MKKFLTFFGLTLFMLSLITITACGDDKDDKEDEPNIEVSPIVGSWGGDVHGKYLVLVFEKNGVAYEEGGDKGTYTLSDNKLKWYVDGRLRNADGPNYTVLTLNSSKLVIKSDGPWGGTYTFSKLK